MIVRDYLLVGVLVATILWYVLSFRTLCRVLTFLLGSSQTAYYSHRQHIPHLKTQELNGPLLSMSTRMRSSPSI